MLRQISAGEADSLNDPNPRENVPQALYYEVPEIKRDQEVGALERRIAAWLYLDQRLRASDLPEGDPRRLAWIETGQLAAAALFDSDLDSDQDFALYISEKIR